MVVELLGRLGVAVRVVVFIQWYVYEGCGHARGEHLAEFGEGQVPFVLLVNQFHHGSDLLISRLDLHLGQAVLEVGIGDVSVAILVK